MTSTSSQTLQHRILIPVGAPEPYGVWFTSAEDIVLRKLDWLRLSGGVLERQRRDVLGVLKLQRSALDFRYLREVAARLGLAESLDGCLRDAGLGAPG